MSAAHRRHQISRICGKEETQKDANELLNIALSKTGPGSGHDLGEKAIALPAICAFLASERLGNNDVVKKVAQDVSCLRQRAFEAALNTVRGALSGYLSRKPGSGIMTPVKNRVNRRTIMEQHLPDTPSRKPTRQQPVADSAVTPLRRNLRPRIKRTADSYVEMEGAQAEIDSDAISESFEEEKTQPTRCRHHVPIFADRLFYHYRDPRVAREWEACEKRMKTMSSEGRRTTGELRSH